MTSRWNSNVITFAKSLGEAKNKKVISLYSSIIGNQHNFAVVKRLANSVTPEQFDISVEMVHENLIKNNEINS